MTLDGNRKHADLILRRGTVITMDPERRILENASVVVEGTRISAVGAAEEIEAAYRANKEIDCLYKAILPGLITPTVMRDTRSSRQLARTPAAIGCTS